MLKFVLVSLLALTVVKMVKSSAELTAFAQVSKDCFDENHVSEQEFRNFYMNGMNPGGATQHIKCHIKCIMEKLQHMKSGVLDINAAVKTWSEIPEFKNSIDSIREGYEMCQSQKGNDDCDTAYKITMCLQENDVGGDLQI